LLHQIFPAHIGEFRSQRPELLFLLTDLFFVTGFALKGVGLGDETIGVMSLLVCGVGAFPVQLILEFPDFVL
jgi:hypothetical protein